MLTRTSLISVLVLLSVGCANSSGEPPGTTAEKLYAQVDQALANHDSTQILSFVDTSYVSIDAGGNRVVYAQYLKNLQRYLAKVRNVDMTTTVKDAHLEHGRLVAYSQSMVHLEVLNDKGVWIPMVQTSSDEETWEKKSGAWKLVLAKTLREQHQIDPRWIEAQNKINQMWLDAAHDAIVSCNYSINGCR